MKNIYHYRYLADGFESEEEMLIDFDNLFSDDDVTYRKVTAMLDKQSYDTGSSVVRRIIEFAESYKNTR